MSIARRTSGSVAEFRLDERGGHAAGDFAGVVAAHAVGEDRQGVVSVNGD
jgi:hypothetical protein